MNRHFVRVLAVFGGIGLAAALSCGGGSSTSSSSTSSKQVLSGNWQISLQPVPPATSSPTESGFLVQSASSVTGQLVLSNQSGCTGIGAVQGTLKGTNIGMMVTQAGQTMNLTGTAATDGSSMGGTYAILGPGCSNESSNGTWTATPVMPVNGTYAATFNSYTVGTYGFTVTITQGANTGATIATLSGTMTSSNAPCGNTATIAGVVSGTSVVLNFLSANGTAVGQFTGTTSADAKNLTGSYDFLAQSSNASCLTGDVGWIVLAQQ